MLEAISLYGAGELNKLAKGIGSNGWKSADGGLRRNSNGAVGSQANQEVARVLLLHLLGLTAKYFWSQSGDFSKTAVKVGEIIVPALESDLGDVFVALSELPADFGDAQFIQIILKDPADARLKPATESGWRHFHLSGSLRLGDGFGEMSLNPRQKIFEARIGSDRIHGRGNGVQGAMRRVEEPFENGEKLNQAFEGMCRKHGQLFDLMADLPYLLAGKLNAARGERKQFVQFIDLRKSPEFIAPMFRQELDDGPIRVRGLIGSGSPCVRQMAAQQNQVAGTESLHGLADITQPGTLANPDQFDLAVVMPQEMKNGFFILAHHESMNACFGQRNQLGILSDVESADLCHGLRVFIGGRFTIA